MTKTKFAQVIALASRKRGVTTAEIAKTLRVSKVAAASLVADARAKGTKLRFKDGVYRA